MEEEEVEGEEGKITKKTKQNFLRPDEERMNATSPEVSAFALSEDKRLLIIGTASTEANLIVWEINTNVKL